MRVVAKEELDGILKKHKLWVEGNPDGEKANLRRSDLWRANLRGSDLRGSDLREADLRRADLRGSDLREADLWRANLWRANLRRADLWRADLRRADLRRADLREADLRGSNLREADLWGSNLDYSCWPLWCGSLDVKVDVKIAAQLAYHFCRLDCDDPAYIQARNALVPLANTFHRVEECGRLEVRSMPET